MSRWNNYIVWIITIGCVISLGITGYYFYQNVEWFKETSLNKDIIELNQASYRIYIFHLHRSLIIRSMGLLGGISVMFLGLASVFFVWSKDSKIDIDGGSIKASILTASPGLLALIIGGAVLIRTIESKDNFEPYTPSYITIDDNNSNVHPGLNNDSTCVK